MEPTALVWEKEVNMFRFISTKIAEYRMMKAQKELEKIGDGVTMEDIYKFNRAKEDVFKNGVSWDDAFEKEFGDSENNDLHTET